MKKSNKGFTLVELIVVIAIIGILAAILVPAMIGYIRDSKLSSANSSAKTVYNAGMAFGEKCETAGAKITQGWYKLDLSKAGEIEDDDLPTGKEMKALQATDKAKMGAALSMAVCSSLNTDAADSVGALHIGKKGFPDVAVWAKGETDIYVGGYPDAQEKPTNDDDPLGKIIDTIDDDKSFGDKGDDKIVDCDITKWTKTENNG